LKNGVEEPESSVAENFSLEGSRLGQKGPFRGKGFWFRFGKLTRKCYSQIYTGIIPEKISEFHIANASLIPEKPVKPGPQKIDAKNCPRKFARKPSPNFLPKTTEAPTTRGHCIPRIKE
jgi:hypothetical protein